MKRVYKGFGRIFNAFLGFSYDFLRYILYANWNASSRDKDAAGYHLVKIYHALEKSMCFKDRASGRGWNTAFVLIDELENCLNHCYEGFFFKEAVRVLEEFLLIEENAGEEKAASIRKRLEQLCLDKSLENEDSSRVLYHKSEFLSGRLSHPESFFLSRYSLREFKEESVPNGLVERVIECSIKTPSVCNRQPWHIYYTSDREVIDSALEFQSGNRGFGHKVPNLMIVTADLKAFMPGLEHYQHWIDGGMFSMSIVYAMHSLGIASCCLNWSQTPLNDLKLRKRLNLSSGHTVIMMIAYGYPESDNYVCLSKRRPVEEYITVMQRK